MNTYVCINITCMSAWAYVYVRICICEYVCLYSLDDVCMFTWVYMSIWMYMCMHVWSVCCVCINVHVYMGECVHLHGDCHMSTSLYPSSTWAKAPQSPTMLQTVKSFLPLTSRDWDLRPFPTSAGNAWLVELGLAAPSHRGGHSWSSDSTTPAHSPSFWSLLCSSCLHTPLSKPFTFKLSQIYW